MLTLRMTSFIFCLFLGGLGFSEKEIGIYQVITVVKTPLQIFFVHRVTACKEFSVRDDDSLAFSLRKDWGLYG